MGASTEQGGFSPFDIIFTAVHEGEEPPTGMTAFSTPNVPCNEAISVSILALFLCRMLFR